VTSITKFGAFVQAAEGVEGMVHVSEISAEKRINHPQDVLKVGQVIKAQVLAIDSERRLMRLSMKQLVPTSLDEYIAEHKAGDVVTGRVVEAFPPQARAWNWAKAFRLPAGLRQPLRRRKEQERRPRRSLIADFHAASAVEGRLRRRQLLPSRKQFAPDRFGASASPSSTPTARPSSWSWPD
jgi:transcriptional accessory protein Tex/SPT6